MADFAFSTILADDQDSLRAVTFAGAVIGHLRFNDLFRNNKINYTKLQFEREWKAYAIFILFYNAAD